ncbi:FecCD family ABC transporter permease [Alteromonas halophila]|uniref:Heme ABC transporter permease n=1 Tax=Alteromonas halophila TaxID=516698 RepID=A0A918JD38_9ALTE|nr:iron ABC transporter permease [Alteromonas halophila]GGW75154.1 heme ABC transporter permease [Alteromonas halophila]
MNGNKRRLLILLFACLFCAAGILAVTLESDAGADVKQHIILHLQLPMITTAALVGAVLCVSAGSLQIVLRNPLADPGLIGISSGASLVAAVLLLLPGLSVAVPFQYLLPLGCFIGALISTFIIYRIASRLQGAAMAVILAGITISTLAGAAIAWLYMFSDAQSLRNLTFWLMGNLYQTDWHVLAISGPVMLGSIVFQLRQAKALNWLYGGDVAAAAAGTSPQQLSVHCLLAAAIGVGAAVAVAGSIAFLGLLVPHLLRLTIGFDNRRVLPAAALSGALVLLIVALLTELTASVTFPVSMLTATVGGPLMLYALYRGQYRL